MTFQVGETSYDPMDYQIMERSIKAVIGHLKGSKTTTEQSIIFEPKSAWTLEQAKEWLQKHKLKSDVDETENSFRFRQIDPSEFEESSFRTITLVQKGAV